MGLPQEPFHTAYLHGEDRLYWSTSDMVFMEHLGQPIVVKGGFLSDGLSIPSIFHSILSKAPSYLATGVLHDWLYSIGTTTMSRKKCDKIFYWYLSQYGVGLLTRRTIYYAVRLGGRKAFRKKHPQFYTGKHQH